VSLRELHLLHACEPAQGPPPAVAAAEAAGQAFVLQTCQRTVVVCTDAELCDSLANAFPAEVPLVRRVGVAAYEALLRLACGLESRLAGETEVFGQIKKAWAGFSARRSLLAAQLSGTIQGLFRDVKAIRSQYLSGIGSASYGSLVRRVLDSAEGVGAGTVLVVGAGQLAASVAPWLQANEIWIWNRSADKAEALAAELRRRVRGRAVRVLESSAAAELEGWRQATHVVACVPTDDERDAQRAAAWAEPRAARGKLVHLGVNLQARLPAGQSVWAAADSLLHMGAMYDLLRASNELRAGLLDRARQACGEKAQAAGGVLRIETSARVSAPAIAADSLYS